MKVIMLSSVIVLSAISASAGSGPVLVNPNQQAINSSMQSDIDKLKSDVAKQSEQKVTIAPLAVHDANPYYIGITGGYVFDTNSDVGNDHVLQADDGYDYGVVVGREFNEFRFEGAVSYQNTDNDHLGRVGLTGDSSLGTAMVNMIYTLPVFNNFGIYGMGGIGGGKFTISDGGIDEDAIVFVGNAGTGITYEVTPNFDIDMGYKYTIMNDNTLAGVDVSYDSHMATMGLRYKF
jgi:opacity protein-like surface antigen